MACLGILAAASLPGCAQAPPASLPAEVTVSVKQYRLDYAPRALEVSVSNDTGEAITVTEAAFRSAFFSGSATWTRDTEIPAGSARDLRVLLGPPVCAAMGDDPHAAVALRFTTADGRGGAGTVTPADPLGTIAKVITEDCIAERSAELAAFTTGAELRTETRDGRLVALLDVTATPTGAQGVLQAPEMGRTILVRPADDPQRWPLGWSLSASSGPLSTTLAMVPSNCNPHIVAEDKRGTFFPLTVLLADGTTGTVFVPVSTAVRGQIYAYIARYCGWS